MKRYLLAIICFFVLSATTKANHITGGEMYYTYIGQVGNDFQYRVTLKLFRDHFSSGAQLDPTALIGVFDRLTGATIVVNTVPKAREVQLQLTSPSPCITNPPVVFYDIGYYEFDLTLPKSANGYVLAYQRCCRIDGISNLGGATGVGATYTAEIPSSLPDATAPINNSARFIGPDTVIVCANNPFLYSFAALDADPGDQLSYSFCQAYNGGSSGNPSPNPPASPPYSSVPYGFPFTSASPLGSAITINSVTGLITGTAPASGIYVVTVCVNEIRGGIVIATQRKDLQIKIGDCETARALLNPRPTTCDGFTVNFQNDAPPSPLINSYFWDFGVGSLSDDTSNLATPTFTYPDTGVYVVKLVTNRNQQCSDSTTTIVKVYPGFFPGFTTTGSCFQNPFKFTDTTNTKYGVVDSWRWNFGDPTTIADTSRIKNPQWTYAGAGTKSVELIVTNSKGCVDTALVDIIVLDKPIITLAFADTLLCRNDAVQLNASGTGTFSWTPPVNIVGANTPTPTVRPTTSQWYYVRLDDNGCINNDSVHVRVVNAVTLLAMKDTTVCQGDNVQLSAVSDGLSFAWTPAGNLNDPTIINPVATVNNTTTFLVIAKIGSCSANDQVVVTTVPYPIANAGASATICYNTSAQLAAVINGLSFTWTPTNYLSNPNILNPVSTPPRTTQYILSVYDTLGCPKPGRDTIVVTVNPKIKAYAGRDTTVIVGQPLQFNGSGGINYLWSPSTGLDKNNIYNPIGVYTSEMDTIKYKLVVTDAIGCADSAYVTVVVFKTVPSIFVPTAFTPNNDGLNDEVMPIAVGIQRINYFSIYNRWGQLVFTTTINKKGWDGRINGRLQDSNVYVWMVSAVDYLGNKIFLKGTVTLIR